MNIPLIEDDGTKNIVERVKAKIAAKDKEIAELRRALQLGLYLLTIPAIQDVMKSQLENDELSPIADFENSASAILEKVTK